MNSDKLKTIKTWPYQKNSKELQRFLGSTGYYRRFIDHYASITVSFYALLKKDIPWFFGSEQIKHKINYRNQFCVNRLFIIHFVTSGPDLGAILAQDDDNKNEYVCENASLQMKGSELNYEITEKECLAVLWAIKLFRHFVYGTHFIVVSCYWMIGKIQIN